MSGNWRTDPTGRHLYRYHDGQRWTDQVADGGAATTDPYDGPDDDGWPSAGPTPPADAPADAPVTPGATPWPTGSTAGTGPGPGPAWSGGGSPGWSDGSTTGSWTPSSSGGGWSTGAKIGATIGVLALMLVSGVIGFALGAAADVADGFGEFIEGTDGFDEFEPFDDRALPGEATGTGVALSSDQPRFEGALSGESSFEVRVTRPSRVEIEVLDADFDTYLLLYDEDDVVVAEDDDGGDSLLSLIDVTLEPGTYTLVVEAFSGAVSDGERIELVARFEQG